MNRKRDTVFAALILLAIWQGAALLLDSIALPEPWIVARDMVAAFRDGNLFDDLAISSIRALLGLALALAAAVPLGLVIGAEEPVRKRLSPFIYLLYPIPHVVLLPLIIILFGIGNLSKIFLIALIVFFQILVTTRDAAKGINRNYYYSMLTLGASRLQIYRHVILPASLPKILTALRISIGTSVAILFFVESFATTKGLGYRIMDSWGRADYVALYTGICCMALLGFSLYIVLDRLEQRICRWTRND
ncbi:ABC transporter permease [Desulfofustis limnaeus]|jgi:NitT/TauT family transport system permease protein|uniref:ABC transporter permease n=1 Tax=Desulfofustis limnaeus TaxID=2740163 RepID=A0ABN6M0R8_9BACT|nr:ABC transporter permease [Desulfofustis limnaeus]MDX9896021.1 ABC transporter permease [Desulfofustis sp.]BDD86464.1 ABC transporter permease [Desulfofustis limnaeus]